MYIKKKVNCEEILTVKHNRLKFYIELLNQINSRFVSKGKVSKFLPIIILWKVLSKEVLPILSSLVSKFSNLIDCIYYFLVEHDNTVFRQTLLLRKSQ